jgi:hypothetical protein
VELAGGGWRWQPYFPCKLRWHLIGDLLHTVDGKILIMMLVDCIAQQAQAFCQSRWLIGCAWTELVEAAQHRHYLRWLLLLCSALWLRQVAELPVCRSQHPLAPCWNAATS